jgi:hypothetical protein
LCQTTGQQSEDLPTCCREQHRNLKDSTRVRGNGERKKRQSTKRKQTEGIGDRKSWDVQEFECKELRTSSNWFEASFHQGRLGETPTKRIGSKQVEEAEKTNPKGLSSGGFAVGEKSMQVNTAMFLGAQVMPEVFLFGFGRSDKGLHNNGDISIFILGVSDNRVTIVFKDEDFRRGRRG